MPDTSAVGYAATLQGEHAHEADRLRHEAAKLREQANGLERQAEFHDERAEWAGELAKHAMMASGEMTTDE